MSSRDCHFCKSRVFQLKNKSATTKIAENRAPPDMQPCRLFSNRSVSQKQNGKNARLESARLFLKRIVSLFI